MAVDGKRVVVVTGASRGAGKGIALALAPDSVVYVTGRTVTEGTADSGLPGTVGATAAEIDERGGKGVAVACDHGDLDQVRALFARIGEEQGHIDILINNATALSGLAGQQPFWERDLEAELVDMKVGAMSDMTSAYLAAPLMVEQGKGLIVSTSSPGAGVLMPGVHSPVYGAAKAAKDKFHYDIAHDLAPFGVATVSLWMGVLATERVQDGLKERPEFFAALAPSIESPEYQGRVIEALWNDPGLMSRSGRAYWTSELADELGVTDVDGTKHPSYRDWCGAPPEFTTVPFYGQWKAEQANR